MSHVICSTGSLIDNRVSNTVPYPPEVKKYTGAKAGVVVTREKEPGVCPVNGTRAYRDVVTEDVHVLLCEGCGAYHWVDASVE